MEVAGLVLGAFPLAIEVIYIYRSQYDKFDDWVHFRQTLIIFKDEIRHQMMLYRDTLTALLDPVIPDTHELKAMTEDHNHPRWYDGTLNGLLAERLGPEDWSRFVRIVGRMDSIMKDLKKILKIKSDEKVGMTERKDTDKPAFTQVERFMFTFSKGKFAKVEKLKNYNLQLSEIISCSNSHHSRPKEEQSNRKGADGTNPSSLFESIRQNGLGIYSALKRHLCSGSQGACESHNVCLCIRADPKGPNLNFLFDFKEAGGKKQSVEYITIEPQAALKIEAYRADDDIKGGDARLHLLTEPSISNQNPGGVIKGGIRNGSQAPKKSFTKKAVHWGTKFLGSPPAPDMSKTPIVTTTSYPDSSNSVSITTASCGHLYSKGGTYTKKPALTLSATTTTTSSITSFDTTQTTVNAIGDICIRIHNSGGGELGIIANENERYFKVTNSFTNSRRKYQQVPRIVSLPELLSLHEKFQNPEDFRIEQEHRLSMAAHVSAMLLQTYSTPWLPNEWSRRDVYFLKGDSGVSVSNNYPYLARPLGGRLAEIPDPSLLEESEENLSEMELEQIARESLCTLGIIITELILGRNICPIFQSPLQPGGPENKSQSHPPFLLDHNAVMPIVSKLENEVLLAAGPELKDVVRRCLKCTFGPAPNLKEKRFRKKIYDEVVKPLANKSELWPEYFE